MTRPGICQDFDRIATLLDVEDVAGHWDHNSHYHDFLLGQLPPRLGAGLDLGCGSGRFSRRLAERCRKVQGIDLSPRMIALARRQSAASNITFTVGDILGWPWPDAAFACVAAIATLHHMPLATSLREIERILQPGGTLLILDLFASASLWRSLGYEVRAVALSRWWYWRRGVPHRRSRALTEAWEAHGATDHYLTLAEIRTTAKAILPGARIRRHALWRYSLIWQKPT